MVTIIGGRVGLDYTVSLNAPGSTGMTLLGQTEAAIVYSGLEAASFTGAYIRPANQKVPALKSTSEGTHFGQVSMLDSVIEYPEGASAACVAMDTIHSLYLSNVYLKNCDAFVSEEVVESVAGGPWYVAEEIAVGVPIPTPGRSCGNLSMPIYVDGKRLQTASLVATKKQAEGPDPSVLSQHIWDEKSFPTWDAPNQINAKDYGAVGDGTTDDAPAIQKAIDVATEKKQVVFLPKGFYRLSRTLNLTCPGLVGTARSLTVLMPMSDGLVGMGTAGEAFPVLHVGNTNDFLSISMLSIVTWEHLSNTYALLWENTNPGSIYRQNYFYRITECLFGFPHPTPVPRPHPTMPCKGSSSLNHPLNLLINGASGKFYNFENEDFLYETPTYRHLMVEHGKDLKFYNLNMEHSSSESNAEFRNSDNVFIYSLKSEGEWRDIIFNNGQNNPDVAIWVRNCSNFYAYSYGGNLKPLPTGSSYPSNFAQLPPSLYRFENTCPLKVTNLVDQISFPKDDDWNFIYDQFKGDALLSEHCDRPSFTAGRRAEQPIFLFLKTK